VIPVFGAVASIVVVAVAAEIVFPGKPIYHAGWFNVALLALVVVTILGARKHMMTRASSTRARVATIAIVFGAAMAGLTGAASGLLAPDNRSVVGAPGQRVRVDDLGGTLDFPLTATEGGERSAEVQVVFDRPQRSPLAIGERGRNAGSYVLRTTPRTVVYVEARDPRGGGGGRLTITQPQGASFLSPVLLMQQHQTIAGLDLPFDSFAVPAAHRTVRAVLFTPQEAATLRGMEGATIPAVLFAIDDEDGRPLPHAITLARSGATVSVGGILLHAVVLAYPAIEIVAAPALDAVLASALLLLGGLTTQLLDRSNPAPYAEG
jgi:hypothetical protein